LQNISTSIQEADHINFEAPTELWSQYGIREYPVVFNGIVTGTKAIVKDSKLVNFVGKHYKVLPNEEAVKISDIAAQSAGFKTFDQFGGNWFAKLNNHTIYDRSGYRVHALYSSDQSYDVNGEKMYLGVGIHNSIDGKMGFGAGIFTFRNACSNMVFAGMKGWHMDFDQRKTLEYIYTKHMGIQFDQVVSNLSETILTVFERAKEMLSWYQEMYYRDATLELFKKLKDQRHIPKKVLPAYIVEDDQKTLVELKKTQWEVYNDLTQKIWHNPKSDITSKTLQFNKIHNIFLSQPIQVKA